MKKIASFDYSFMSANEDQDCILLIKQMLSFAKNDRRVIIGKIYELAEARQLNFLPRFIEDLVNFIVWICKKINLNIDDLNNQDIAELRNLIRNLGNELKNPANNNPELRLHYLQKIIKLFETIPDMNFIGSYESYTSSYQEQRGFVVTCLSDAEQLGYTYTAINNAIIIKRQVHASQLRLGQKRNDTF